MAARSFPTDKLKPISQDGRPPVVLVACGSFSPITHMHLRMFEMCAEALESDGFEVVGSYLSPVSDAYGKKGLVAAHHRVEMCRLASLSTAIMVDSWEAEITTYTPTRLVLEHFESEIVKHYGGVRPRILFACGTDLLESFNRPGVWAEEDMDIILGRFGLACLQRESTDIIPIIAANPIIKKHEASIRVVKQWMMDATSSTSLRHALAHNLSVRFLTPDSVIAYIKQHDLYAPASLHTATPSGASPTLRNPNVSF